MLARFRLLLLALSALVLPGCLFLLDCKGASERKKDKEEETSDSEEAEPVAKRKRKRRAEESAEVKAPKVPSFARPELPLPPKVPPPEAPRPPPAPSLRPSLPPAPPPPVAPPPPAPAPTEDRAQVKRWVLEVALGMEFPGANGPASEVVRRWTKPIRVSVMRGGRASRTDLSDVVTTLDGLLRAQGLSMEIVGDGDPTAKLQVFYAPSSDLSGIASAHGFKYVVGNDGFFHTFWNAASEIDRVFVLLATDKLSGKTLRHFTFEELAQALGLARDSAIFSDSLFFANGDDGGSAQELSALDRKLVTFLYAHTRPGDGRATLSAAFDRHWR
jgi:hypothetical protein